MTRLRARSLRGWGGRGQAGGDGLHGQDVVQQVLLLPIALVLHVPHVELLQLLQLLDVAVSGAARLPLAQVGRGGPGDKSTWVGLGLLVQVGGVA